jgi:CubicO group peptidase (beta-lactamase class C family)
MFHCLCAVTLAAIALPTQAPPTHALDAVRGAKVDAIVHRTMRDRQVRGLELGITRNGLPIYTRGYGVIGDHPGRPVTDRTVMPIGSLTKAFTAAALNALARAGRLSRTDKLEKYFSDYAAGASITLDDLLTMRSGIPDYSQLPAFDRTERLPVAPETLFASVAGRPLDFTPGTRTEYDNTNYLLAALVVQRVSGEPYAGYLQRTLLDPLRLDDTRVSMGLSRGFGCADLESNLDDMLKWLRALDDDAELHAPPGNEPYNDGFFTGSTFGRPITFASGYVTGYSSVAERMTRERLNVVMLADTDSVDLSPLANSVIAIVLDLPEASPGNPR